MDRSENMEDINHLQDFTNKYDSLIIKNKLKKVSCNVGFNTGGILILLSLVLGIYLGGVVITGKIDSAILAAQSDIFLFSSKISEIATAAELLVNICNKPEIAPLCKNNTMLLNLI